MKKIEKTSGNSIYSKKSKHGELLIKLGISKMVFNNSEKSFFLRNYSNTDIIWRYMDLSKFLFLLETKQLYFTRLDKFEDKYEGEYPIEDFQSLSKVFLQSYKNSGSLVTRKDFLNALDAANKYEFYANCWHCSKTESYGMWKSYLKTDEGIAIKTNVANLKKSLRLNIDDAIEFGNVEYLDYRNESIIESYKRNRKNGIFAPPLPGLFKRKEFENEKEFRIIALKLQEENGNNDRFKDKILIQIDPATLIENLYLSPFCGDWYLDLINRIIKRYGLNFPVVRSGVNAPPDYK